MSSKKTRGEAPNKRVRWEPPLVPLVMIHKVLRSPYRETTLQFDVPNDDGNLHLVLNLLLHHSCYFKRMRLHRDINCQQNEVGHGKPSSFVTRWDVASPT